MPQHTSHLLDQLDELLVSHCTCRTSSVAHPDGIVVVVHILGDLDLTTCHIVAAALDAARERRPSQLIVDTSGIGFCSVRGIGLLIDPRWSPGSPPVEHLLSGPVPRVEQLVRRQSPAETLPQRHPTLAMAVQAAIGAPGGHTRGA